VKESQQTIPQKRQRNSPRFGSPYQTPGSTGTCDTRPSTPTTRPIPGPGIPKVLRIRSCRPSTHTRSNSTPPTHNEAGYQLSKHRGWWMVWINIWQAGWPKLFESACARQRFVVRLLPGDSITIPGHWKPRIGSPPKFNRQLIAICTVLVIYCPVAAKLE